MKKTIWVVVIAGFLLGAAGCSLIDKTAIPSYEAAATPETPGAATPADETAPGTAEPSDSPGATDSAAPSSADEETPSSTPPASTENGGSTMNTLGEALLKSEGIGAIKLNMSEAELVGILGEPEDASMPEVWGSDGLAHTDWNYETKGLVINMAEAPETGSYVVFTIKAMEPCTLKTSRGIAVGDTKESVLAAYSAEYNAEESDEYGLVFGSVYGGMIATIDDGKVVEIFIGAAAE